MSVDEFNEWCRSLGIPAIHIPADANCIVSAFGTPVTDQHWTLADRIYAVEPEQAPAFFYGPDPSIDVPAYSHPRAVLARYESPEEAAMLHAVLLDPPEVDFINRAIED